MKKMDLTSLPTYVFSFTTSHFSRLKLQRIKFASYYGKCPINLNIYKHDLFKTT